MCIRKKIHKMSSNSNRRWENIEAIKKFHWFKLYKLKPMLICQCVIKYGKVRYKKSWTIVIDDGMRTTLVSVQWQIERKWEKIVVVVSYLVFHVTKCSALDCARHYRGERNEQTSWTFLSKRPSTWEKLFKFTKRQESPITCLILVVKNVFV